MRIIGKRKTHEEFVKQLSEINPNIKALDIYFDSRIKIKFECLVDGHIWEARPAHILQGKGCPICAVNRITKSQEQFLKELNRINKNVICLDKYINMQTKIRFQCLVCDHIWETTPNHIARGQGCPECAKIKSRKTNDNFLSELKIINQNVNVLENYINYTTKLLCECLLDGNRWYASPASLLSGHGCPECWKKSIALDEDIFLKKTKEQCPNINILTSYTKASDYYLCECKICGHKWMAEGWNIIKGKAGCKECNISSKGEIYIKNFLEKNNINFIPHKTFDNLKGVGGKYLSYDFYISEYNLLIEFQGIQHEHPIDYFGGEEQFAIQQEHDKRKREYAKLHKITLLEIWYYDINNIEEILNNELFKLNKNINNLKLESVETVTVA